jgi:hypothetical protein
LCLPFTLSSAFAIGWFSVDVSISAGCSRGL